MSQAVFPAFTGLKWGRTKTPQWSTRVQTSASGREARAAFYPYPIWKFGLSYEVLRAGTAYTELQQLVGFFNARQGSFDSFLYTDPNDNTVTNQVFAVAPGGVAKFKLARNLGGVLEPVGAVNGSPSIYKNGVLQGTGYTIDSNANITFTTAPASGDSLSWTGAFYYRVRFDKDASEFSEFLRDLWELRTLNLVSVRE
jgi:uncharacterized protein (TIGR02217 family)